MTTPAVHPWSFTSLKLFNQCPKKYYHLKIAKDYKEPEGEALLYGNKLHKAAEHYISRNVPLPREFEYLQRTLDALNSIPGTKTCELKLGLDANLDPCGFFDKQVWWRGAIDLFIQSPDPTVAYIFDYKTGTNTKYADLDQLEVLALAAFRKFPKLKKIRGALLYVQTNDMFKKEFEFIKQGELWARWCSEYDRMEAAAEKNVWNPIPSGLCRKHCIVTECPHNGCNQ